MAELVWKGKHRAHACQHTDDLSAGTAPVPSVHRLIDQRIYPPDATPTSHSDAHEPAQTRSVSTWYNRLIQGDTQQLLPMLQSEFAGAINLIYIDPPFMTGRTFGQGERLAYHDTWNNDLDRYLQWLYETLSALYTLLASDGSLYIHLDWRTIHYAKIMLDEIFSSCTQERGAGFKNEIIWHYQSGGRARRMYARKHDTLLLYTRSGRYCFHGERVSPRRGPQKRNHMRQVIGPEGQISWTIRTAGRVYTYDENTLLSPPDVWSDISHLHQKDPERTGYATQKPEALLERILLASSEENDLVLDCFCGSGVTPVVAERLGRRWIACDRSELAISTTSHRLLTAKRQQPFLFQHSSAATGAEKG